MNRTYNIFVDNGMFVSSYYLEKEVEDINLGELKTNIGLFAEELLKLVNKEKGSFHRSLAYLTNNNSCLTQIHSRPYTDREKYDILKGQLDDLLDNIGSDKVCYICGDKTVNIHYEVDRKFMPGLISQTFFNSANNLQTVDVCPRCMFFSLLSFMNVQRVGRPCLYLSDSNFFMKENTANIQDNLKIGKHTELKLKEGDNHFIDTLLSSSPHGDMSKLNYVTRVFFTNGQNVEYEEYTLTNKKIKLLKEVIEKDLLDVFMEFNLFRKLLEDMPVILGLYSLSWNNFSKWKKLTQDDKKEYLKKIKSLTDILEGHEMVEHNKNLIEKTVKMLTEVKSIEDIKKELKLVDSGKELLQMLVNYMESKWCNTLLNPEELEEITSKFKWGTYKMFILHSLILTEKEMEVL